MSISAFRPLTANWPARLVNTIAGCSCSGGSAGWLCRVAALALMLAALGAARNLGFGKLHLDTLKSKMPSAVVLYQTLGFVEVPAQQEGGRLPDLIDMELDLAVSTSEE